MNAVVGRAATLLTHALQVLLLGLLGYALATLKVGLLVNVGLPFLLALFPLYVRVRHGEPLNPVLSLWIATAATLHATGALGLYKMIPVFDQIAHGVSGAMVAGVGYALVRTVETHHDDVVLPGNLRFLFVIVFASAFGVVWEVAEFLLGLAATVLGGEPLLAQYGLQDAVLDLLFNLVGAVVVGAWATSYFDDLRAFIAPYVGSAETE